MKKSFLAILLLFPILAGCLRQGTDAPFSPPSSESTASPSFSFIPIGDMDVNVETKAKTAPAPWGQLLTIEQENDEQDQPLPLFRMAYAQGAWALYQSGVNRFYWTRRIEEGECVALRERYKFGPDVLGRCSLIQHGLYNGASTDSIPLRNTFTMHQDNPEQGSVSPLRHASFDVLGIPHRMSFSPGGKYFAFDTELKEGCAWKLFTTMTGNPAADADDLDSTFSCPARLAFSPDEKVVVVQSQFAGGQSPATRFAAIHEGTLHEMLPLVLDNLPKNAFPVGGPEIMRSISVTSVDDTSIRFDVVAGTSGLTPGSFEYRFGTKVLKRLK